MAELTDRELLERAAKAAGYELALPASHAMRWSIEDNDYIDWNPLKEDGDALRLAIRLGFIINIPGMEIGFKDMHVTCIQRIVIKGDGQLAATRRAIVRAAASLATEGGV